MRVLVVEDHAALAREISRGLRAAGFAVDTAGDGGEALAKIDVNDYDVVVLDRDLPVIHGDDVCRAIVAREAAPRVLMLTAASALDDIVNGLTLGADDYLPKPFAMQELVARTHVLGRRAAPGVKPLIEVGSVRIEPDARRAMRHGRELSLSAKEFGVLEVLASRPDAVVSAETLLEKVWDEYADPFTNAVRVTMVTLRRKLGEPSVIDTIKGSGYVLRADGDVSRHEEQS
jgi:DNA-binding response OmpR family regulator